MSSVSNKIEKYWDDIMVKTLNIFIGVSKMWWSGGTVAHTDM